MGNIVHHDVSEMLATSGMVEAGDFFFLTFCEGNVGQDVKSQIQGAFDDMERRLRIVGLTLANVVKIDVMLRDPWNIPLLEEVLRERYLDGKYPARKTIGAVFAHRGGPGGLEVQIDAVAYRES